MTPQPSRGQNGRGISASGISVTCLDQFVLAVKFPPGCTVSL